MLLAIFVICFFAFCLFVIIKANLKPNTRKGEKRKFIRDWDDELIFDKKFGGRSIYWPRDSIDQPYFDDL